MEKMACKKGTAPMKEWQLEVLDEQIRARKPEVDKYMLQTRHRDRPVRRRARDETERIILDRIAVKKWKDAEDAGKIKYLSKNEWYYEY